MDNRELYELASDFYETRLWELIDPNELLGIDLGTVTGYIRMHCDSDQNVYLHVYPGAEGLSSFRGSIGKLTEKDAQSVGLDILHCAFLSKVILTTPIRRELRRRCADLGLPFTDSTPILNRHRPYMANDKELAEEDARAMVLVFRVLLKLSAVLKAGRKTKKDLGIRIIMTLFQTNLVETEPGSGKMEAVPFDKEVLIPVFKDTTEGFQYTTEVLPPYAERAYNPPKSFEDPVFTKLLEHEKKGDYDADFIHLPKMIDGDPSYYPETLVLINREDPDHVHVFAYPGPFIEDTDRFLIDAAYQMLDENTVPQRIRYRSSAVKTVLKPLFDRVGIKTRKVQHLDTIDFFLEQFDRFREDSSSANRAGQTRPGPAKTESEKTFSVFEIAKMEVEPVYKLAEYSKEDLAALLIRRRGKLSPELIRKIYSALRYDS